MSFRNVVTEEEKKRDDERKSVLSSSVPSTAVFKFGPVNHPIGKPLTRSQMKANNDYEVSKQVAKLRKVVEREIKNSELMSQCLMSQRLLSLRLASLIL